MNTILKLVSMEFVFFNETNSNLIRYVVNYRRSINLYDFTLRSYVARSLIIKSYGVYTNNNEN